MVLSPVFPDQSQHGPPASQPASEYASSLCHRDPPPPFRFPALCLPYFPPQWWLICENKMVIFDFARIVLDLLRRLRKFFGNRQRRSEQT